MESTERNASRAGWHSKLFGDLAEFKNGLNYSKDNIGKGLKIIGVSDFQRHSSIEYNALAEVSGFDDIDESYLLREDDLLFVRSNGNKNLIGRVLHIKNIGQERITFSGFTIRARINSEDILPAYAALLFSTPEVKARLFAEGGGTNIANLNQDMLSMIGMPLPPIDKQAEIIAASQIWEDAIALQVRQLKQLRRRKDGIAQELLLGKKRLSEFRQRDWGTQPIGEVAEQVSLRNANGELLTVLSCTKYNGLVDSLTYFGRQMYSDDLSTYKVVPRNTFAYATNHIEEGSIGYQSSYDQALISPMYTVFRTDAQQIDDDFLYHLLKSDTYIEVYRRNMSGSINRRGGLRWVDFSQIAIPAIQLDEQRAISNVLTTAANEIRLNERRLEALREQKGGLLQKLLNGQILLS